MSNATSRTRRRESGAAQAAAWVQPRKVVPMHFGTYPILAGTPAQFKAELGKRGLMYLDDGSSARRLESGSLLIAP